MHVKSQHVVDLLCAGADGRVGMPSRRIKFRGAYEPYLIGANRPHDFVQWRGSRKPRFRQVLVNEDPALECSRCRRPISVGGRHYVTKALAAIHELC
jgi:hypothetical protein